ncbi:hypothetical protein F1C14_12430 [Clostridium perfringens]|nr:hypothetical protein F1C14_12430 [Clostridium perfringens]
MEDKVKLTEKYVNFSKTEINKSEELPGAELKVVRGEGADGDIVQKWTSTDVQKQLSLKKEPTQWLKLKLQMDMK